jgi:hypothetical protein
MGAPKLDTSGVFHTTDTQDMRRQIWAGQVTVASGGSTILIRNRGQYARCWFEVFFQAAHGSNGYGYYLANLSKYGTGIAQNTGAFSGSISTSSTNSNQYNGVQVTASANTTYLVHVNVYYHNTETGLEVDSPAGLSHIGTGV